MDTGIPKIVTPRMTVPSPSEMPQNQPASSDKKASAHAVAVGRNNAAQPSKAPLAAAEASKQQSKDALQNNAMPQQELDKQTIEEEVDKINQFLQQNERRTIQFTVDEESNRTVIRVLDSKGEQIKQFPPEEVLQISRRLAEQMDQQNELAGMLVSNKA